MFKWSSWFGLNNPPAAPTRTFSGRQTYKTSQFHTVAFSQGAGYRVPPKEDRVLAIEDLYEFVHTNYKTYSTQLFGDYLPPPPSSTFIVPIIETPPPCSDQQDNSKPCFPRSETNATTDSSPDDKFDKFKLFGVFDGHCGEFASSYLQYRFPFQLCGSELFKQGKYEEALKETFSTIHQSLKNCTKYGPERPKCDYTSGSTASVILVTPTVTYFAFLGDSPIIVWKHSEEKPDILFHEHDSDHPLIRQNLIHSNVFLVLVRERMHNIVYYLVTHPEVKESLFHKTKSKDEQKSLNVLNVPHPNPLATVNSSETHLSYNDIPGESFIETQLSSIITEITGAVEETTPHWTSGSPEIGDTMSNWNPSINPSPNLGSDFEDEDAEDPEQLSELADSRKDNAENVILKDEQELIQDELDKKSESKVPNLHTHQYSLPPETLEYDDIRVGLSALNVYGTLGDCVYDPDVFNTFIEEVTAFKRVLFHKYEEIKKEKHYMETANLTVMSNSSGIISFTSKSVTSATPGAHSPLHEPGTDFDPVDFTYEDFRDFIKERPAFTFLSKHIFFLKNESECSRVLLAAIRYLNTTNRIQVPGLLRVPETTSIPNHELKMFIITSDGVIRFYDKFKTEFQNLIMSNEHQPEKMVTKLKNYMKWLGDDRSIITCRYGSLPKKPSAPKMKLIDSKMAYQLLRNKRSSVILPTLNHESPTNRNMSVIE